MGKLLCSTMAWLAESANVFIVSGAGVVNHELRARVQANLKKTHHLQVHRGSYSLHRISVLSSCQQIP